MKMNVNHQQLGYDSYYVDESGKVRIHSTSLMQLGRQIFRRCDVIPIYESLKIDEKNGIIMIWVKMDIKNEDNWVEQVVQFGTATINDFSNKQEVDKALELAIIEATQRCYHHINIGTDVESIQVILPNRDERGKATSRKYKKALKKFNLPESKYYHGVPVLPNHLKKIYSERNWSGIFLSDITTNKKQILDSNEEALKKQLIEMQMNSRISNRTEEYIRVLAASMKEDCSEEDLCNSFTKFLMTENISINNVFKDEFRSISQIPRKYADRYIQYLKSFKESHMEVKRIV